MGTGSEDVQALHFQWGSASRNFSTIATIFRMFDSPPLHGVSRTSARPVRAVSAPLGLEPQYRAADPDPALCSYGAAV
jgi:hypothetical protein